MKVLNYKNIFASLFFICICFSVNTVSAHAENSMESSKKDTHIHISADQLVSNSNAMYAEFIGNVVAVQDNTTITADKMKIYYDSSDNKQAQKRSIKKISATGNVEIKFGDRIATTKEAVYRTKNRTLILIGDGSRVTNGDGYISGSKITLNGDDGCITAHSGSQKRVEAVFQPAQENDVSVEKTEELLDAPVDSILVEKQENQTENNADTKAPESN